MALRAGWWLPGVAGVLALSALVGNIEAEIGKERTVLFAVLQNQVTPIAYMERGVFSQTPGDSSEEDPEGQEFAQKYYLKGKQFELYEGGGRVGIVEVEKPVQAGCMSLMAEVVFKPWRQADPGYTALALNYPLKAGGPTRRPATAGERSELEKAAHGLMKAQGATPEDLKATEASGLYSMDVNRDGRRELVGSFNREHRDYDWSKPSNDKDFHVFVVLDPQGKSGKQWAVGYQFVHKSDPGSDDIRSARLVDNLDLTGDGIDELVLEGMYYESTDYQILKRTHGKWKTIFQGGGFGC